jgi:hypothetical protein
MSQTEFDKFIEITLRNLQKNGFPENAVSFSTERMYEEADKRGFSFNKVRDHLVQQGINSELVGEKVVFRSVILTPNDCDPNMADMMSAAEALLAKLSPTDREKMLKMVRDMTPEQTEVAKKQWESMSSEEKARVVQGMGSGK